MSKIKAGLKKIKVRGGLFLSVMAALFLPPMAVFAGLIDDLTCVKGDENCTIDEFKKLVVIIANFILSISGGLALLMFVLGGAAFLLTGIDNKWHNTGKETIKNAVIGLVIVLIAWLIVKFVAEALGVNNINDNLEIKV